MEREFSIFPTPIEQRSIKRLRAKIEKYGWRKYMAYLDKKGRERILPEK